MAKEQVRKISPGDRHKPPQVLKQQRDDLKMQNGGLLSIQTELEKSRKNYLDLFDSFPVGCLKLDDQNLILEANLKACRILGAKKESLIGQCFTEFVSSDDRKNLDQIISLTLKTGIPQRTGIHIKNLERKREGGGSRKKEAIE